MSLIGKLSLAAQFHGKTCETCPIVRILREELCLLACTVSCVLGPGSCLIL